MNTKAHRNRFNSRRGFATVAVVTGVSLALISMLTFSLVSSMSSQETQMSAQLKQDYSQKEDAILSALLHIVPNKAIGAMQEGSAANTDLYTWNQVFEEALDLANAEQSADSSLLSSLGLTNAITANTGDTTFNSVSDFVNAPSRTHDGSENLVNGGNHYEYHMFFNNEIGDYTPAPLLVNPSLYQLDKAYPLISLDKIYVYNYNYYHSRYYKGVYANTDDYPIYNLLEYPDVKFGYKRPGDRFVAKRNWWTFSLTFGQHNQDQTGVPPVKKNYVLSIYEVPSQLPLSSSAIMQVGQFADGSDWENVSLDGGLYADSIETQGDVSLSDGSISARRSVTLSDSTSVRGNTLATDFGTMGRREARGLSSQSDFYDASVAGDVGKVAFIPINPGPEFLKLAGDGSSSDRISPTGWNYYSRGAEQAKMRIEIREMNAVNDQIPVTIRFHYENTSGNRVSTDFTRGANWPTELETGGDSFPFQTDALENGRNALVVNLDRIPTFLSGIGGAASIATNNSIYVYPNSDEPTVVEPSVPSLDTDLAITLRGGKDLTAYTKGFSVVTDMRMYIAETLNSVTTTVPTEAGLDPTDEYYPPVSLFAPEKRFGETAEIDHPVAIRGQLSSLKTSSSDTFNPMELVAADDNRVDADLLDADLVDLKSPAELPPIYLMNWLITIEEVH